MDLSEEYLRQVTERRPIIPFPINVGRSFYLAPNPIFEQSISAYAEQHKLLRELSEQSDCVIVGRCADYVLRDRNPFRIFIYADQASKIKRCMERKPAEEELSQREMKKKMAEIDRNRSKYYEFSANRSRVSSKLVCALNTTDKDIEKMASAVVSM